MDGPDKLRKFIARKYRTQSAFAGAVGLAPATVSLWLSRKRAPGLRSVLFLDAISGGYIRVRDWPQKGGRS